MNLQAALVKRCLDSFHAANQPGHRDSRSIGDELQWEDSPTRLAGILKARLLSPSTAAVNFLALAVMVLEGRAHA